MALASDSTHDEIRFLDESEGHLFFDKQAWRLMGMSGAEFIRRYDAGDFDKELDEDGSSRPGLAQLVMLLPFAR